MAFNMQRSRSSHSMRSMHRPLSRASTTSAASPAPEMMSHEMQQHYMQAGHDAALMQQYARNPQVMHAVAMDPMMNQHMVSQQLQAGLEQYHARPYVPQDHGHQYMVADPQDYARMSMQFQPSMSVPPSDAGDDRRRKNSAATATNDKELRELLNKNESRVLKDVAQEVIQKERTPQAEKTKQLFAMLWYVDLYVCPRTPTDITGCARSASLQRHRYRGTASTQSTQRDVAPNVLCRSTLPRLASSSGSSSLGFRLADLVFAGSRNTTTSTWLL